MYCVVTKKWEVDRDQTEAETDSAIQFITVLHNGNYHWLQRITLAREALFAV